MDDFMQENGSSYVDQGDNQFLTMGDIHNPSEFDISILPDFMSPGGAIHNIVGYSTLEPVPGEGKGFSESVHVSASTSSAYHSGNGSPSSMSSQQSPRLSHEAHPKSMYHRALQEHEAVIAAQEGWPCFRCNPPLESSSCPKTARIYLEGLEQTLKNQDTWNSWGTQRDEVDHVVNHEISTEPFAGCTRDKLLAITQSFLHKALEIHRTGPGGSPEEHGNSDFSCAEFIILPPPN
ncbi:MAG: hypothetical protein M1830_005671, partial [Pleopsidium flavum]